MTATASDTDELRELDANTVRAWRTYSDQTRALSGQDYEQAERESWEQLQAELRRLERRRESLNRTSH
jgi:hypothetical protein